MCRAVWEDSVSLWSRKSRVVGGNQVRVVITAAPATISIALPTTHGKVTAGTHLYTRILKAAWLRILDSPGTHGHLIIHWTCAWRWEEPSGSSSLHSNIPHPTREEVGWLIVPDLVGPHVVRLEPGRALPLTQWKKPDLKDQSCAQKGDWEAYSSWFVKQGRHKKRKEVWTFELRGEN